ncbi:hypothetical protein ACHAXA_004545 [Cyclostephanos tholiformis]|uniref:RRM domain-containing protein n=1 Tax=Cyclostephanos tholiformis TaxID=382380 RepID=A0ABD3R8E4_9STRA
MSNIKSWGDVSSDEDSVDERPAPRLVVPPPDDDYAEDDNNDDDDYALADPIIEGPPYTAFLGNLSYEIRSSNDLSREIENLLREKHLGETRVGPARLMLDRSTGQSKGFGYVEFDSGEELLAFLRINNPQLCGRPIKVDVANGGPVGGGGGGGGGGGEGYRRGGSRGGGDARPIGRGGSDRDLRGGGDRGTRGGGGGGGNVDPSVDSTPIEAPAAVAEAEGGS